MERLRSAESPCAVRQRGVPHRYREVLTDLGRRVDLPLGEHTLKRAIIGLVSVGVLLAGCGASSSGGGSSPVETQPVGGASTPASSAPAADSSSPAAESGDWKFSKVVSKSNYGLLTATVRATNITGEKRSGMFTVTYFNKAGDVLGTATGAANDVPANKTVTVQLISGDDINLKTVAKTEIQVDGSF
jgi:hypothetical protein